MLKKQLRTIWIKMAQLAGEPGLGQVPAMVRFRSFRSRGKRGGRPSRGRDIVIAVCMIFLLALIVARLQQGQTETLQGQAKVVDGDSLIMADRRLRLNGIDAPEFDQQCQMNDVATNCGRLSADYLRGLVEGRLVTCFLDGVDRYGRDLAECKNDGTEINLEMVRSGWAVAYGDYLSAESNARAERAGLWAGEFDNPAQWRRMNKGRDEPIHGSTNGIWSFLKRLFGVR